LAEIIRRKIGPPWFSSLTIRQRPLRRLRHRRALDYRLFDPAMALNLAAPWHA